MARQPREIHLTSPRAKDLGPGESEVLTLALDSTDPLVLLDDALARETAESLGIPFTGTLGLLIDARKAGHLEAIEPYLAKLAALRFRISPALRDMVIELVEG
jgi:predicted nucleic acid-binding protein